MDLYAPPFVWTVRRAANSARAVKLTPQTINIPLTAEGAFSETQQIMSLSATSTLQRRFKFTEKHVHNIFAEINLIFKRRIC